jgi:hypothetical protein
VEHLGSVQPDESGTMNRKVLSLVIASVFVVGWIALRTQGNALRDLERERGYASVEQGTVNGFSQWYSRHVPLTTEPGRAVECFAAISADPSRLPFALVFRNAGGSQEAWEASAKKPVAIFADGRRYEMKPFQALVSEDGTSVIQVSVVGPRPILEAVADVKAAAIEFGGKRYDLDERGLANCRELLRRSER